MAKNSSNDVVPTTEMMESPEGTSRGEKNKEEEKKNIKQILRYGWPVTKNILYIYFLQEIAFKLSRPRLITCHLDP